MDESGRKAFTASRESALHENYTILEDGDRLAFMKHRLQLGGLSYEIQDASGNTTGVLHCKLRKGALPEYWYEDAQGNTLANLVWEERTTKFSISDPHLSQPFAEASLELPGGMVGDLKALVHKTYSLSIYPSSTLPLFVTLAFCVAVADIPA